MVKVKMKDVDIDYRRIRINLINICRYKINVDQIRLGYNSGTNKAYVYTIKKAVDSLGVINGDYICILADSMDEVISIIKRRIDKFY